MAAKKQQISMTLQFGGNDFDLSAVEANIKKDWKDAGKKLTDMETLDIYVKPEEATAYYVVNKDIEGKIDL